MLIKTGQKYINGFYGEKYIRSFCEDFISPNTKYKKIVFGRNIYLEYIIKTIKIDAIIDDFYKEPYYKNIPIVKIDEVPKDSLVLIICGGHINTAIKRVESYGLKYIDYFSFYQFLKDKMDLLNILFNEDFEQEYERNEGKFINLLSIFADDMSKKQFENVVNFRYSKDLYYLADFSDRQKEQYFEDFLIFGENEVFLDVGAYDGYTTEQFIFKVPDYKSCYVFEPLPENMKKVKERLRKYRNVLFYEIALSDKNGELNFMFNESASNVDEKGNFKVKAVMLDDIINEKYTYLKIDVEGFEINVLEGAKKSISKYKPKIAVSVYHKPAHLYLIPEKILSYRSDYKLYLRHYTESIYETIMFFV